MFGGVGEGEWLEIALVAVDNKSPQNLAAGPHRSQKQYLRGGYAGSFMFSFLEKQLASTKEMLVLDEIQSFNSSRIPSWSFCSLWLGICIVLTHVIS